MDLYPQNYDERREVVKQYGLMGFKMAYLPHYYYLPPAEFHFEMDKALEDPNQRRLEIVGFRGSAKSTDASLALPLYAALELPHIYPFIVPIAGTDRETSLNVSNIKAELETNDLILQDYGFLEPKRIKEKVPKSLGNWNLTLESDEEWQAKNMLLKNGVRITGRSRGQRVRGIRHRQHRPKLIPIDDVEDIDWLRFKENRDADEQWFRGQVMPAADPHTGKIVLIGNWLHDDGLMARMKKSGVFKLYEYPLINKETYVCLWPFMYPTIGALDAKRDEMGEVAWQREMLLKVVPSEGAVVRPEDIHYYDSLPDEADGDYKRGRRGHGVDFAISLKSSADYTTCVDGDVWYFKNKPQIYLLPNPLNAHLDFSDTLFYLKQRPAGGGSHIFFPEDVGYQKAAIQEMVNALLAVHPVRPATDKRSRLMTAATYIKNGTVMFPRTGCEDLINQILNFGVESHDDLADGLTNLILGLSETGLGLPGFVRG